MSDRVFITVARPADWPAAAEWSFRHLTKSLAARRADHLVQLMMDGEIPGEGILIATQDGVTVGGIIVQYLPGGSAVVLLPGGESEEVRDALVAAAVERFPTVGVSVAQSFIDPGEEARADVLTRHGFRPTTKILHLTLDSPAQLPPSSQQLQVVLIPYSEADPGTFAETLLTTYQDSFDVPEANAGRSAADAVSGYQFCQPNPPTWWLATDLDGTPVGVLLLSGVKGTGALEVAYLGVVPPARGRGVGGQLLTTAIQSAASERRSLELSVDVRNQPAIRLYTRHGCHIRHQQDVYFWIQAVSAN